MPAEITTRTIKIVKQVLAPTITLSIFVVVNLFLIGPGFCELSFVQKFNAHPKPTPLLYWGLIVPIGLCSMIFLTAILYDICCLVSFWLGYEDKFNGLPMRWTGEVPSRTDPPMTIRDRILGGYPLGIFVCLVLLTGGMHATHCP